MPLPADRCRCHDARCPERDSCLRWIERFPMRGQWVVQSDSLRAPGYDGRCINHLSGRPRACITSDVAQPPPKGGPPAGGVDNTGSERRLEPLPRARARNS